MPYGDKDADLRRFISDHPNWLVARAFEGLGYQARRRDPHSRLGVGRTWLAETLNALDHLLDSLDQPEDHR